MGCLVGVFRLLAMVLWRALLAAFLAMLFARVDEYVERRWGAHPIARLYRWRRGTRIRRGTPADASSAIETKARGTGDDRTPG